MAKIYFEKDKASCYFLSKNLIIFKGNIRKMDTIRKFACSKRDAFGLLNRKNKFLKNFFCKQFLPLRHLKLTSRSIWYFEVNFCLFSNLVIQNIFCEPHLNYPLAGVWLSYTKVTKSSNEQLSLRFALKNIREGPTNVVLSH